MTLTKTQLENISQNLVNLYNNLEREMLINIAKRLSSKKELLKEDPETWMIHQLEQLGMLDKQNLTTIKKSAGLTSAEINAIMYAAGVQGLEQTDNALKKAIKFGAGLVVPKPITESPIILNILTAYQRQAKDTMNLVNQTMLIKSKQLYTDVLNRAALNVISGKDTHDQALRKAIAEMAENGIPALVDKAGKKWGVEGYVRTVLISTAKNTMHAAQDARFEEYGVDFVEVTSHMGARPLCAPYQGRIFQLKGNDKYPNLYTETSYGKPAGLFGINCGHRKYPFIPGVNIQRYFPYDDEENDKAYKESQLQRAHERAIRKAKTQYEMYKAIDDKEGMEKASELIKDRQSKMRDFIKKTGRTRRNYREQIHTNKKLDKDYKRTDDIEKFIPKDPVAKKKTKTDIDIPKEEMKPTQVELSPDKKEIVIGDTITYDIWNDGTEIEYAKVVNIKDGKLSVESENGFTSVITKDKVIEHLPQENKEVHKQQGIVLFDPTALDDAEKSIRYDDIETGFIFDKSGKEVWKSKGTKSHVDLQDAINKGFMKPGYTFTHNHPKDTSLSLPDIQVLVAHGLAEMRAIGKNNKHSMKLTDKYDPSKGHQYAEEIKKKYHDIDSKVLKELNFKIAKKELTIDEANSINQHMVWERLVKEVDYIEYNNSHWPDVVKEPEATLDLSVGKDVIYKFGDTEKEGTIKDIKLDGAIIYVQDIAGDTNTIHKSNIIKNIANKTKSPKPIKGNDDPVLMPKKNIDELIVGDKVKFTRNGKEHIGTIEKKMMSGKINADVNGVPYQFTKDNIVEHVPDQKRVRNLESFKLIDGPDHTDVKSDTEIISKMKRFDKGIINKYTSSYYGTMNGHLRFNRNNPDVQQEVDHLYQVMKDNAHEMTEDVILFRRFDADALQYIFGKDIAKSLIGGYSTRDDSSQHQEDAKRMLLGGAMHDKGFVSSTYKRGSFGDYKDVEIEFYVPKGYRGGMFVESISEFAHEKEYIFNSGKSFEIIDVEFNSDNSKIKFKMMPTDI